MPKKTIEKEKKQKFRSIKISEESYLKLKKWSAVRDIKLYELVDAMVLKA